MAMVVNEDSQWEEAVEIDGLTLYDIHRQPRKQIANDERIKRSVRSINSELTCPVCLGVLHSTMIVMECLHRFCSECIQKCLRVGRKECPSCRIHVPSRRSLRYDTNFDAVIGKIYPNLDEYEENEEKMISDFNKARNLNNAFTQSCRQGMQNQLQHRRKKARPLEDARPGSKAAAAQAKAKRRGADAEPAPASKRHHGEESKNLVNFCLKKHPTEEHVEELERQYLRTAADLKIVHMKKYLQLKMKTPTNNQTLHFEIVIVNGEKAIILDDQLTLKDVCQHFWDGKSDVILHFRTVRFVSR
mmetsp:Transcript_20907/g.48512  ORF Transcript_20907/g.48512 Transcript_20907/m.48512 type:complete len:302 (+) Transcript_20907:140-1045(+)